MRVDPSRSAEAAAQLLGGIGLAERAVLVCDRYVAYVKLEREHPGQFELAVCWAHVRRDFVTLRRTRPDLQEWVDGVLGRLGKLYRLNAERLVLWDPQCSLEGQSGQFPAVQGRLETEFGALCEQAQRDEDSSPAAGGACPRRGRESEPSSPQGGEAAGCARSCGRLAA